MTTQKCTKSNTLFLKLQREFRIHYFTNTQNGRIHKIFLKDNRIKMSFTAYNGFDHYKSLISGDIFFDKYGNIVDFQSLCLYYEINKK